MYFKCYLYFLLIAYVSAQKVSYDGHKLYNIVPKTDKEVDSLLEIKKRSLGQFWEEGFVADNKVRIMVKPEKESDFLKETKNLGLTAKLVIEDIQKAINDQMNSTGTSERSLSQSYLSFSWDQYYDLDHVYNWLDELAEAHPDVASTVVIGESFENREIKAIVIDYNRNSEYPSPAAVIDGALHAREWITTATVTWIIKEFLTSTDSDIRRLAESFQWHIIPVVNPDGYVYSFTTDRMWRKNRSTDSFTSCSNGNDDMSNGVDLNRNFDFAWNTTGTSPDPCANNFPGPIPFSEPETRAFVRHVQSIRSQRQIFYYLAFHSYQQKILVPYSHTTDLSTIANSYRYAEAFEIAIRSADKMKERFGTEYEVGPSGLIFYPLSGSSLDWITYELSVPVSFLIESRDLGEYGFLLPPEQIIPASLESMDFLLEMNKYANKFVLASSASTAQYLTFLIIAFISVLLF